MIRHDGGPAFPAIAENGLGHISSGMTLRDYFAAKAMQAITTALQQGIRPVDLPLLARDAYALADAMLKERDK